MADRRRLFSVASFKTDTHAVRGIFSTHKRGIAHQLFAEISASVLAETEAVVVATDATGGFNKIYRNGKWRGHSSSGFVVQ